jgi:hypothetical protein
MFPHDPDSTQDKTRASAAGCVMGVFLMGAGLITLGLLTLLSRLCP